MNVVAFVLPLAAAVVALLAFGVAMLSDMRIALVTVSLLLLAAVVTFVPRTPQDTGRPLEPFRLVSANTFADNRSPGAAAAAIAAQNPAVVVSVETREAVLEAIGRALPGDHVVHVSRLDVFSAWPLRELSQAPSVPLGTAIRVLVRRPGSPFVLYAVHLANPLHEISFSQHAVTVERLLHAADGERLPVVLAGDFNMSDRTTSYRLLDGAMNDAMRSTTAGNTYEDGPWVLLQLRIDHVFTSRSLCAADGTTFNVPGSDHEGLSVELGRCA
jgi:endonuclease/exonuclease/phosphatase (EEP) superfamily protein YafD